MESMWVNSRAMDPLQAVLKLIIEGSIIFCRSHAVAELRKIYLDKNIQ